MFTLYLLSNISFSCHTFSYHGWSQDSVSPKLVDPRFFFLAIGALTNFILNLLITIGGLNTHSVSLVHAHGLMSHFQFLTMGGSKIHSLTIGLDVNSRTIAGVNIHSTIVDSRLSLIVGVLMIHSLKIGVLKINSYRLWTQHWCSRGSSLYKGHWDRQRVAAETLAVAVLSFPSVTLPALTDLESGEISQQVIC